MTQLTVKEALEQGYTLAGRSDEHGYQCLYSIDAMIEDDFKDDHFVLAEKDGNSPTVDADSIAEMIINDIKCDELCFNDDTNEIDNIVKEAVDFKELAEKINVALESHKYYRLTKIKLLP